MHLSDMELDMLKSLRQQSDGNQRIIVRMMAIGGFFLLAGILMPVVPPEFALAANPLLYGFFGFLTLSAAVSRRDGDPKIELLLKVIDHLAAKPVASTSPQSDTPEGI